MPKIPEIKTIEDFEDPVNFCFYMFGYIQGVRGKAAVEPEEQNRQAYEEGVLAGEHFTRWLLLQAANNKN